MKTAFTTGQIAKLCNVSPRTVAKWMDTGVMDAVLLAERIRTLTGRK